MRHAHSRLMTMARVAELLGDDWSTDDVRRFMIREGIGTKRGGRWYITRTQVRAVFPELAVELEVAIADGI